MRDDPPAYEDIYRSLRKDTAGLFPVLPPSRIEGKHVYFIPLSPPDEAKASLLTRALHEQVMPRLLSGVHVFTYDHPLEAVRDATPPLDEYLTSLLRDAPLTASRLLPSFFSPFTLSILKEEGWKEDESLELLVYTTLKMLAQTGLDWSVEGIITTFLKEGFENPATIMGVLNKIVEKSLPHKQGVLFDARMHDRLEEAVRAYDAYATRHFSRAVQDHPAGTLIILLDPPFERILRKTLLPPFYVINLS